MELDEVVSSRRSVRKYKPNMKLSEDQIKTIISFCLEAPSWKNLETGRYYIALSEEARKKVLDSLPSFNANNVMNACAYVICAYKMNHSGFNIDKTPSNELGNKWGTYDLGLQNQLLILKAKEMGIDSLIMGIRDASKIKVDFNIPDEEEIVSIIALGYRDVEPIKPKRKQLEEISKIY